MEMKMKLQKYLPQFGPENLTKKKVFRHDFNGHIIPIEFFGRTDREPFSESVALHGFSVKHI